MIEINNHEHGFKIAQAAGCIFNPAIDQVISRSENGVLFGGNIFTGYTGASIHTHTAGFNPMWANRVFLWMLFDYPFNQLGCKKVFGQVPESNSKALEIYLKLGFKVVARIEDVFLDGACLVIAITREDCQWLKRKPYGITLKTEV